MCIQIEEVKNVSLEEVSSKIEEEEMKPMLVTEVDDKKGAQPVNFEINLDNTNNRENRKKAKSKYTKVRFS